MNLKLEKPLVGFAFKIYNKILKNSFKQYKVYTCVVLIS